MMGQHRYFLEVFAALQASFGMGQYIMSLFLKTDGFTGQTNFNHSFWTMLMPKYGKS